MFNTRNLVRYALLIVLQVLLTQFVGITLPALRITFTFLAYLWVGYFYGWKVGALIALASDLIGMVIYPKGPFLIGFTLSAVVSGIIYGLVHNKDTNIAKWVLIVTLLDSFVVNLFMNTLWLVVYMGNSMSVIFIPRLIKVLIAMPIMYFSSLALMKFMSENKKRFQ